MSLARLLPLVSAMACGLAGPALAATDFAAQTTALEIARIDSLPSNPDAQPQGDFCAAALLDPQSAGGRQALAAHWIVTAEEQAGPLTFVSFVGGGTPGTSGSCDIRDGNIAVFRDDALEGLIYAAEGESRTIGAVVRQEDDLLRIWDGGLLSQPLADLLLVGEDLVILRPVATRDNYCGGRVGLPNLYGLPIGAARRLLLAEGWEPRANTVSLTSPSTDDIRAVWPELEDCAGTGFGYCGWNYDNGEGDMLFVTTVGEVDVPLGPVVSGVTLSCAS